MEWRSVRTRHAAWRHSISQVQQAPAAQLRAVCPLQVHSNLHCTSCLHRVPIAAGVLDSWSFACSKGILQSAGPVFAHNDHSEVPAHVCSWGGELLWPSPTLPVPAACNACGAARRFELQVMPALHHALAEGLASSPTTGSDKTAAQCNRRGGGTISGWSWQSVAVFTCAKSCDGREGGLSFAEEHVEFLNE